MMITGGKGITRSASMTVLLLVAWGLFCRWVVPGPTRPQLSAENAEAVWMLPPLGDQAARENAYQAFMRLHPWGKGQSAQKAEAPAPAWMLRGIVDLGGQRFAFIGAGDEVRRYSAGDALPQGETVVSIGNGSIEVKAPDGLRRVYLYPKPEEFKPPPQ